LGFPHPAQRFGGLGRSTPGHPLLRSPRSRARVASRESRVVRGWVSGRAAQATASQAGRCAAHPGTARTRAARAGRRLGGTRGQRRTPRGGESALHEWVAYAANVARHRLNASPNCGHTPPRGGAIRCRASRARAGLRRSASAGTRCWPVTVGGRKGRPCLAPSHRRCHHPFCGGLVLHTVCGPTESRQAKDSDVSGRTLGQVTRPCLGKRTSEFRRSRLSCVWAQLPTPQCDNQ
jgi:hypothetical protein